MMDRTSSNGGSPTVRSAEIQHVDNEAISFDYSEGLQPTDNPHPPPLVIHPPSLPAVSASPSLPPPAHISTPTFTDKFNTSSPPNARPLSAATIKNRRVATDSPSDRPLINEKNTNELPQNSNNFFANNPQLGVGGSAGANDLMMQSHHVMMQRQQQRNQQKQQQQQQLTLQHNNMTRQGKSLPHMQQPLLSPSQQRMERVKPHTQAQYSSATPLESPSLKQLDHYSNTHNYTQPLSLQSPDNNNQLDYLRSQGSSRLSPEHKRSSSLSPTRYKRYNPDNRPPNYVEGPSGGHLAPPSLPFNRSTSDPMEPVNPKSDSINDLVESKTSHNFYERPDIKMKMKKESDGEILIGSARPSYSVQQLLCSVQQLWEMNLPPELYLSHLEDCLMSLNERGQIISNGLLEQMHTSSDVQVALQKLHAALNTSQSDEMLLHSLAGVHVSNTDHNLSKDLQVLCLHSLVK